jgi:predicted transposase/invertase (TIGR01784 family)
VAILEQVAKAEDYRPKLQVYTIVVLTSGDKHKTDVAISDFTPKDLQGNALGETEHKIIYLCPKYVTNETPEQYREWLRAIDDTLDGEVDESQYNRAVIQQVFEHIEQDKVSPEERARMFDEHGQEELRQEEFEKGVEKGKAEGKAEGEYEKALAIAQAMLEEGEPLEKIAKFTGLTITQIEMINKK